MNATVNKPPLLTGHDIPLNALSADQFEDFIFSCLLCIGPTLGFRVVGKPSGTGDGGFDIHANRLDDQHIVCIQCKRQAAPLDTPLIAEELAKVAAHCRLDGTTIIEHRFICTGGVRNKLRAQLRNADRQELVDTALNKLVKSSDLSALKKALKKSNHDPREVVESYINGLEEIVVWNLHEFDVSLSSQWPQILPIVQRFFQVERLVLEHPRALFDREAYIQEHRKISLILEPHISPTTPPSNLDFTPSSNPGPRSEPSYKAVSGLSGLTQLDPGDLAIVLGAGGSGKTEILRLIRAKLLQEHSTHVLPILLPLNQYSSGHLDDLIHRELDVTYGSWRTLPDRIVLLCDGLNECASHSVGHFLDEIRPILRRNRAACIITMRDVITRSKVILPEATYIFAKVESISPIGIQRLAEAHLEATDIIHFVRTYRSIADNSGSPLLWTPFAVLTALRQWKSTSKLPPSLGEMLEVVLDSRALRNTEYGSRQLDPEVILLLAGALAFQRLIIDGKLECPATEAGTWIRAARIRCQGALGISDMTEQEIIEILISHDLLRRKDAKHYGFEHQLVAGALAAPLLAMEWRNHMESLSDEIADDVWVFGSRLVPERDIFEYLDALLNVDLVLGARAARDLPPEPRSYVLTQLKRCVSKNTREAIRIRGAFALATLGSQDAKVVLETLGGNKEDDVFYASRVALATTGDPSFLDTLLEYVEMTSATPIQFSGGDTAVWAAAPFPKKLDAARRRLSQGQPGDAMGRSLIMISLERDSQDIPLIKRHVEAATDLGAWGKGLHALNVLAPSEAIDIVRREIASVSSSLDRIKLLHTAFIAGVLVDANEAFQRVLDNELILTVSPEKVYHVDKFITNVISKLPIPQEVVDTIEINLIQSSNPHREHFWKLAPLCKSKSIATYSEECIVAWNNQVWAACNYLLHNLDIAYERRYILIAACEKGVEGDKEWWSPRTIMALTLIGRLGYSKNMAKLLGPIVDRFHRVREAVENSHTNTLGQEENAVLSGTLPVHHLIDLTMKAEEFLPIITLSREKIPSSSLCQLLNFEFYSVSSPQELRSILTDCSDEDIDNVLAGIREPMTLVKGLAVVCHRGATAARIRLIGNVLQMHRGVASIMKLLIEAIDACWCQAILEVVVDQVSAIREWKGFEFQLIWDLARVVARNISNTDQLIVEGAIKRAQTANAKRILDLWYIEASQERIGMGQLTALERQEPRP